MCALQVANFLCPGNYVVSGSKEACAVVAEIAKPEFKARMTVPLAVAGAFHTDFMAPAVPKLEAALQETAFAEPRLPVISNVDAAPHSDPDVIKGLLAKQVRLKPSIASSKVVTVAVTPCVAFPWARHSGRLLLFECFAAGDEPGAVCGVADTAARYGARTVVHGRAAQFCDGLALYSVQVTSPVMWEASLTTLLDKGLEQSYEIGPNKVIAGIMKRINRKHPVTNITA